MSRIVYLNGEFLTEEDAKVSVFDRGFLMADAVYEYTAVIDGKLSEFDAHIDRLKRSLGELQMQCPLSRDEILQMHRRLVAKNNIDVGGVYLQISRGIAERDFLFPDNTTPTVTAFTQTLNFVENPINEVGLKVVSVEDGRWIRRDIKSVQLLYTSMVKTDAVARGANDAFFVKDGFVTEATSANAFIVKDGRIITRQLSSDILHGVMRKAIMGLRDSAQLQIEERPFSIAEAQAADEVFITASPIYALPVVEVDGVKVGTGRPGDVTRRIRTTMLDEARSNAI
ncbi:D-amino-acid transaminase [Sulfitobacter sp. F26204]|uniref:D-amino-acid transaminase n=1 Tax=Sulfitobacter sp. F26204 TaxID=2996014 RepID=UPI00225E35B4|nr:D-amino-acid transaminase [Sulfitobacter sp. F26204]MCX7560235.1 D-amino-acid transaminase [Sulfitobacter sp. F26204]